MEEEPKSDATDGANASGEKKKLVDTFGMNVLCLIILFWGNHSGLDTYVQSHSILVFGSLHTIVNAGCSRVHL